MLDLTPPEMRNASIGFDLDLATKCSAQTRWMQLSRAHVQGGAPYIREENKVFLSTDSRSSSDRPLHSSFNSSFPTSIISSHMDSFKAIISFLSVAAVPEVVEDLPVNEEKDGNGANTGCVVA